MKKTLIALALTALPVAAMADVVLYGQIKGGIAVSGGRDAVSTFDKTVGNTDYYKVGGRKGTITQMEDYGSRIGFKGEEDLGNGLKAIWQVEQSVSLAGKQVSQGWNNRDTFIGLEGGFGKVRAGYVSDQFNENMETMDIWEYKTGKGATARGLGIMTRFDTRHQGVRYDSPDFAGFNFNITHNVADSAAEGKFRNDAESEGSATVVGLNYENAGFFGKLGYGFYKDQTFKNEANGKVKSVDGHVARVEGGYDANNLFVGLAYQYAKNMPAYDVHGTVAIGGTPIAKSAHEAAVSVAYTIGAITPKFTYAHGWDQKVSGEVAGEGFRSKKVRNSGYDQVIIGADYALSKRTTALVSAGWIRSGAGVNKVSHNNSGTVTGVSLKDESIYSVGVGLRHKF